MLEEYYSRVTILNSNPEFLQNKPEDIRNKLRTALNKVSEKMESSDEELKQAMSEFITTFDELGLQELDEDNHTRSISFRRGTKLPRQIISDVTILTLKKF